MILTTLILMAAPAESAYRPLTAPMATAPAKSMCGKGNRKMNGAQPSGEGIANLPFSYGKRFDTLDAYLAHLECHAAPIDQPWWQQIRPGVYQEVTTATDSKPVIATRAQLMKRFGFRR